MPRWQLDAVPDLGRGRCALLAQAAAAWRVWRAESRGVLLAGECLANPIAVMKECPDSCEICSTVCMDHDESCPGWAKDEQCDDNKAFMYRVCPGSCGVCQVCLRPIAARASAPCA